MNEPFTITVTGWELALLAFAFYMAGAYTFLVLTKHRDPDRPLTPRQHEDIAP